MLTRVIHSLKLKIDDVETISFLLERSIFRGYVRSREVIIQENSTLVYQSLCIKNTFCNSVAVPNLPLTSPYHDASLWQVIWTPGTWHQGIYLSKRVWLFRDLLAITSRIQTSKDMQYYRVYYSSYLPIFTQLNPSFANLARASGMYMFHLEMFLTGRNE